MKRPGKSKMSFHVMALGHEVIELPMTFRPGLVAGEVARLMFLCKEKMEAGEVNAAQHIVFGFCERRGVAVTFDRPIPGVDPKSN